jgi:hypothetical protein
VQGIVLNCLHFFKNLTKFLRFFWPMWLLFEYFSTSILFELLSCVCANVASLPPQKQVARLDSQVLRYKTAADTSEKSEEELKTEKRKLQREVSNSLQLLFSTSPTLNFASGTFSTNLLGEKACQVAGIFSIIFSSSHSLVNVTVVCSKL